MEFDLFLCRFGRWCSKCWKCLCLQELSSGAFECQCDTVEPRNQNHRQNSEVEGVLVIQCTASYRLSSWYALIISIINFQKNTNWLLIVNLGFHAVIKIDGQLNRAMFNDKTNQYGFNATASVEQQCRELEATVTFSLADIFKPIDIEMTYMVTNQPSADDLSKFTEFQNQFHYYRDWSIYFVCLIRILRNLRSGESERCQSNWQQSGIQ